MGSQTNVSRINRLRLNKNVDKFQGFAICNQIECQDTSKTIQNSDLKLHVVCMVCMVYNVVYRERKKATMETAETRKARLQCDSGKV